MKFPFFHILPTFIICVLFDDSCSDRYEVMSHDISVSQRY